MRRQSATGFQEGPPAVGASPNSAVTATRPTNHARTASLFSFRNRSTSAPSGQKLRSTPPPTSSGDFGSPLMPSSHSPPAQRQPVQTPQSTAQSTGQDGLSPLRRSTSVTNGPNIAPPLHPEIRSVLQLSVAHAHKVYYSGPLVRRVERQPDGNRPAKDEGWREVWGQLGGTTLSIWDMQEIEEANKRGDQVPPTYVNVTDAFVHVLGSVTVPATATSPPKKYTNVVTLNTAGSNLLLFSCPTTAALISWATALRLTAWEKSRLEEIYTAHLLRMSLSEHGMWKEPRSPLLRGKMEGWVKVRVAGQTDWKRLWLVVQSGSGQTANSDMPTNGSHEHRPSSPHNPRKNRMSALFSRPHSPQSPLTPHRAQIAFFLSPKPKDKKKALLTVNDVTQAFAVYPERPELISRSTLIKLEGLLGEEELSGGMRGREGWVLIMPEVESGKLGSLEMLKWLVGLHDAFALYGRPQGYTWEPRDPVSMMFAYPVGQYKDLLFLDRELGEKLDPRDDRTSAVRSNFLNIVMDRMREESLPDKDDTSLPIGGPPSLPQLPSLAADVTQSAKQQSLSPRVESSLPQLPPLSFDSSQPASTPPAAEISRTLTPITERSNTREGSTDQSASRRGTQEQVLSPKNMSVQRQQSSVRNGASEPKAALPEPSVLGQGISNSPAEVEETKGNPMSPLSLASRYSQESVPQTSSFSKQASSNAKLTMVKSPTTADSHPDPADVRLPSSAVHSPALEYPPITSTAPLSPPVAQSNSVLSSASVPQRPDSPRSSVAPSALISPHTPTIGQHTRRESIPSSIDMPSSGRPPSPPPKSSPIILKASTSLATSSGSDRPSQDSDYVFDEAGALYYMQQQRQEQLPLSRNAPQRSSDGSDADSDNGRPPLEPQVGSSRDISAQMTQPSSIPDPLPRRQLPIVLPVSAPALQTNLLATSVDPEPVSSQLVPRNSVLGRRPSGARARPPAVGRRFGQGEVSPLEQQRSQLDVPVNYTEISGHGIGIDVVRNASGAASSGRQALQSTINSHFEDPDADALAALTFLEQNTEQPTEASQTSPPQLLPEVHAPPDRALSLPSPQVPQYRSSFAPSKQAAERKARSQAQQAAHDAAVHKPGRPNGKVKIGQRDRGAWNDSSDEEEEEEEDDADSDEEPLAPSGSRNNYTSAALPSTTSTRGPVHPNEGRGLSPSGSGTDDSLHPNQRAPRTLPQIPRGRSSGRSEELVGAPHRRIVSDQNSEGARRTYYDDGLRAQPQIAAGRQSVWSTVLDAGRHPAVQPDNSNQRDTFVQLNSPAETITKAFTPQGLLSAGLQDKQDRSAKRQEEVARETGASLINVPNKPPPPQTGLLGAITAHERERKREGGVGAALTERERERRLAEERQRKLDEYQRQQLDQQQQLAQSNSMYGAYNGLAPQMTGYNPMLGVPFGNQQQMLAAQQASMYFNPMFANSMAPFANPQHMFAAQQAAQAYQQAMMSMSAAGSQIGGDDGGRRSPNVGVGSPSPNQLLGGTNMNMGFDPRMSMMGMPGMGMGMGMGFGGPLGMQMTGGSSPGFDPRFSMGGYPFDSGLRPPGDFGQGQQRNPSYNGSPAVGSSAAGTPGPRQTEGGDEAPRSSSNVSQRG